MNVRNLRVSQHIRAFLRSYSRSHVTRRGTGLLLCLRKEFNWAQGLWQVPAPILEAQQYEDPNSTHQFQESLILYKINKRKHCLVRNDFRLFKSNYKMSRRIFLWKEPKSISPFNHIQIIHSSYQCIRCIKKY